MVTAFSLEFEYNFPTTEDFWIILTYLKNGADEPIFKLLPVFVFAYSH